MKKIYGIIGAMDEEIVAIKRQMQITQTKTYGGCEFFVGTCAGQDAILVRCGIGKVNAAICAQNLINIFNVNTVINTGVAGAIASDLDVGDVVISDKTVHHDFDTTFFEGDEYGQIPRMNTKFFHSNPALSESAFAAAKSVGKRTVIGTVASGDQFVANAERKRWISETFNAACVEMESAAIGQTCFLNDVPFVIIRAISDKADEHADINFSEFVIAAADTAAAIVLGILKD